MYKKRKRLQEKGYGGTQKTVLVFSKLFRRESRLGKAKDI
jgi:hypothetical protein